jgi:hypothetical protein
VWQIAEEYHMVVWYHGIVAEVTGPSLRIPAGFQIPEDSGTN